MTQKKKLKGKPLNLVETNLAMYGCADPDMPLIPSHIRGNEFKFCAPTTMKPIGQIVLMGTGDDFKGSGSFEKLWSKK